MQPFSSPSLAGWDINLLLWQRVFSKSLDSLVPTNKADCCIAKCRSWHKIEVQASVHVYSCFDISVDFGARCPAMYTESLCFILTCPVAFLTRGCLSFCRWFYPCCHIIYEDLHKVFSINLSEVMIEFMAVIYGCSIFCSCRQFESIEEWIFSDGFYCKRLNAEHRPMDREYIRLYWN